MPSRIPSSGTRPSRQTIKLIVWTAAWGGVNVRTDRRHHRQMVDAATLRAGIGSLGDGAAYSPAVSTWATPTSTGGSGRARPERDSSRRASGSLSRCRRLSPRTRFARPRLNSPRTAIGRAGAPPARFYLLHGLLRCGHPKPRAPYLPLCRPRPPHRRCALSGCHQDRRASGELGVECDCRGAPPARTARCEAVEPPGYAWRP